MNSRRLRFPLETIILSLFILLAASLHAQTQTGRATLSGTITDASGKAVPNATVSVKNLATGQSSTTQTDPAGLYRLPNLALGDHEVSVSAEGFSTNIRKTTISGESPQTLNLTLAGVLSLGDLGFSQADTQGSAQDQARLDKRSHMLRVHQRLGLIAAAPLFASVVTGTFAGGNKTSSADRYTHLALGSAAGDFYFMSAYYAIRAPRIPGTETRGPIRLHKVLAWIHGPGMILTPILGAIAFDQKSRGQKVHGIASAHGGVAIATAAAYGAAILSVSVKF